MDAETARWVAGVAIGVVLGLIGLVWGLIKARQDKAEERQERADGRLANHITDDISVHERVVRVETEVHTLKEEVRALRDMRHEILDRVTRVLGEWYANIIERLKQ